MEQSLMQQISQELVELLGTGRQAAPFSQRYEGFDLTAAYEVVAHVQALRAGRGEKPVGRKVGFTNRNIWDTFGISAPIWNFVFDRTVHDASSPISSVRVSGLPEPLIEPELVLHLSKAPTPDMREADLIDCVDWVAGGFEIVYSIFPGWKFNAADAAAGYGMHGMLFIGPKLIVPSDRLRALKELGEFSVELGCDTGETRTGHADDVLGGPLRVLQHLADEIARYPGSEPLRAGELVSTGTLTEAMPAVPGATWSARFEGIDLKPLQLRLE